MSALVFRSTRLSQPIVVDFNPSKEIQADIEARYEVDFSDYFETREKAEQAIKTKPQPDSYSGFGSLPVP